MSKRRDEDIPTYDEVPEVFRDRHCLPGSWSFPAIDFSYLQSIAGSDRSKTTANTAASATTPDHSDYKLSRRWSKTSFVLTTLKSTLPRRLVSESHEDKEEM
jgi:hypothetical protein